VRVDGRGTVVVQHLHEIGLVAHLQRSAAAVELVRNVDHQAVARRMHCRADRHGDVDGVAAAGVAMADGIRRRLGDRKGACRRERRAVRPGRLVGCRGVTDHIAIVEADLAGAGRRGHLEQHVLRARRDDGPCGLLPSACSRRLDAELDRAAAFVDGAEGHPASGRARLDDDPRRRRPGSDTHCLRRRLSVG
jgi:hypothetical protein